MGPDEDSQERDCRENRTRRGNLSFICTPWSVLSVRRWAPHQSESKKVLRVRGQEGNFEILAGSSISRIASSILIHKLTQYLHMDLPNVPSGSGQCVLCISAQTF